MGLRAPKKPAASIKLSAAQLSLIVDLFIDFDGQLNLIRTEFHKACSLRIDKDVLQDIQSKYAKRIVRRQHEHEAAGLTNPLMKLSFRMKCLLKLYEDASEYRIRGYESVHSDGSKKAKKCQDIDTMIKIQRLAHDMERDYQKLEIDRNKIPATANISNSGGMRDADAHADDDEIDPGFSFG